MEGIEEAGESFGKWAEVKSKDGLSWNTGRWRNAAAEVLSMVASMGGSMVKGWG